MIVSGQHTLLRPLAVAERRRLPLLLPPIDEVAGFFRLPKLRVAALYLSTFISEDDG